MSIINQSEVILKSIIKGIWIRLIFAFMKDFIVSEQLFLLIFLPNLIDVEKTVQKDLG